MRPVRLPPCAAGASPTSTSRAAGSPKPGTGRAQYVCSENLRTLTRAASSRQATSRGQARHATMRACSSRSARDPPCAPTMRNAPPSRAGAGSAPARAATAAAARAAARHLLRGSARSEPALRLVPRVALVGERAAEAAPALGRTLVLRLVDDQGAAAEVLPVQLGDRLLRLVGVLHVDEGEAARPSRVPVGDDLDAGDRPPFSLHQGSDLLLGGVERQVSHVEAVAHVPSPRRPFYDRSAPACATSAPLWHLPGTPCRPT